MTKQAKTTGTTKKAQLIALLQRKAGVSIADASERLGWQQHTTRAALTGLRKTGYDVEVRKPDGGGASSYHITGEPAAAKAA